MTSHDQVHKTGGVPVDQLTLLIKQIDALSKTLVGLDQHITDELESVDSGQLYFLLAKFKSKCEKMKKGESMKYEHNIYQPILPKSSDAHGNDISSNISKPAQQFFKSYHDLVEPSNGDEIFTNRGYSKASTEPVCSYYDKSKSFFDNISRENLKNNVNEKNHKTFGTVQGDIKARAPNANKVKGYNNNKNDIVNNKSGSKVKINKVPPHLKQLASECIELLEKTRNGSLSYKDFISEYYECFGYKINQVEQKTKLIELLEEMPSVVSIVRYANEELHVELAA